MEGYVNAIERESKVLHDRSGEFTETVKAGAFQRAIDRADDIRILLDHDISKDLGGLKDGNLELSEDAIGLKARAEITDPEAIEKARDGKLRGWSFGFRDVDVPERVVDGVRHRDIKDMDLYEVSLIDDRMTPAYSGTLVNVRADSNPVNYSEQYLDQVELVRAEDAPQQNGNDEEEKGAPSSDLYKTQIAKLRFELEEEI